MSRIFAFLWRCGAISCRADGRQAGARLCARGGSQPANDTCVWQPAPQSGGWQGLEDVHRRGTGGNGTAGCACHQAVCGRPRGRACNGRALRRDELGRGRADRARSALGARTHGRCRGQGSSAPGRPRIASAVGRQCCCRCRRTRRTTSDADARGAPGCQVWEQIVFGGGAACARGLAAEPRNGELLAAAVCAPRQDERALLRCVPRLPQALGTSATALRKSWMGWR
mmetsp:Transcript_32554/g.69836  ORF Transcript_32554/g.69836 Transcript_32554/m.69836 type:complete len:227 (+) Transcript_32554:906-1586(+)